MTFSMRALLRTGMFGIAIIPPSSICRGQPLRLGAGRSGGGLDAEFHRPRLGIRGSICWRKESVRPK